MRVEPAGANSFTEGQARSRIEEAGFTGVSELRKDDQGIWRGRATRGGQQVGVDDGTVTDDQSTRIGDGAAEGGTVASQRVVVPDFEAAAQFKNSRFVHRLGNNDIRHGNLPC